MAARDEFDGAVEIADTDLLVGEMGVDEREDPHREALLQSGFPSRRKQGDAVVALGTAVDQEHQAAHVSCTTKREIVAGSFCDLKHLSCLVRVRGVGKPRPISCDGVLEDQQRRTQREVDRPRHRRGLLNVVSPSRVAEAASSAAAQHDRASERGAEYQIAHGGVAVG